jgi:uncharacterized membrane protein YdjX (TVP38/TMEM64 family)
MVRQILGLGLAVAVLVALGQALRGSAGIDASPESIRAWIDGLGWIAPVAFLGLVTFRFFFFLPSVVVLTAGGICFGTAVGGALGALGVFFTGLLEFVLLRTVKPAWLVRKLEGAGPSIRALERGAPFAVGLSTAIPPTPMTPIHCAAAFTSISLGVFSTVLFVGSVIRSYSLAFLGSGLLSPDATRLIAPILILTALVALPFVFPSLRNHLFPPAR